MTEIAGEGATYWICIRKVLFSSLVRDTDYCDKHFRGFPYSVQANSGGSKSIRLLPLRSKSNLKSLFINHHSTLYSIMTANVLLDNGFANWVSN
jgi:hypothetical protein